MQQCIPLSFLERFLSDPFYLQGGSIPSPFSLPRNLTSQFDHLWKRRTLFPRLALQTCEEGRISHTKSDQLHPCGSFVCPSHHICRQWSGVWMTGRHLCPPCITVGAFDNTNKVAQSVAHTAWHLVTSSSFKYPGFFVVSPPRPSNKP